MENALCYRITKCRIEEVSRMLSHADSLRTLNGTFWKPNSQHNFLLCNSNVMLLKIVVLQISGMF